jgi:midasin
MSRLERSIASDAIPAFLKEPTQPLAAFIGQSLLLLTEWIQREAPQYSNIEVIVLRSKIWFRTHKWQVALTIVKAFKDYVRDILDSTKSLKFDEGVFQSYLGIGKALISQALQCSDTDDLGSKIQDCLDKFKASWELTTGTSMEILWNRLRPITARSSHELNFVLRMERIADRFDSIVWRANGRLDKVIKLRRLILGVNPLGQSANLQAEDALEASIFLPQ